MLRVWLTHNTDGMKWGITINIDSACTEDVLKL